MRLILGKIKKKMVRRKTKKVPNWISDLLISTFQTHLPLCYRVTDLEPQQSAWSDQPPHLCKATNLFIGGISGPTATVEKQVLVSSTASMRYIARKSKVEKVKSQDRRESQKPRKSMARKLKVSKKHKSVTRSVARSLTRVRLELLIGAKKNQ